MDRRKLLVLLPLISACTATTRPDNRFEVLDHDVAAYYDHIRWSHYEEATAFLAPKSGKEVPLGQLQRLNQFHISTYELLGRTVAVDHSWVKIAVRLDYYNDQTGAAKSGRDEQTWRYIPETRHWKIDGSFPDFFMQSSP